MLKKENFNFDKYIYIYNIYFHSIVVKMKKDIKYV